MPGPVLYQHGQVRQGVPDGRVMKMTLQTFDGSELYHRWVVVFRTRARSLFVRSVSQSDLVVSHDQKTSYFLFLDNTLPVLPRCITVGRWKRGALEVEPWNMLCKVCSKHLPLIPHLLKA